MKAMMLAAGFGTRLRPLTMTLPKPLFPVMGRPVMEHLVRRLGRQGFDEIVTNLHHLPDPIIDYFGDGSRLGVQMRYSREMEILGTAGGLLQVQSFLDGDTFLLINSDIVVDLDLQKVLKFHRDNQAALTLVLFDGEATGIHDPIEIDDTGRIVHMVGASSKNIPEITRPVTFTGIQLVEPEIFDRIPQGRFCGTTSDVYPEMIEDGCRVFGYMHTGYWQDMGTREQYLQVHRDVLDGKVSLPALIPSVHPPAGMIKPPVWMGQDCTIAATAEIGPYAVIGNRCVVEDGARIENSVLWDEVQVQQGAHVTESVVARKVVVEAGEIRNKTSVINKK